MLHKQLHYIVLVNHIFWSEVESADNRTKRLEGQLYKVESSDPSLNYDPLASTISASSSLHSNPHTEPVSRSFHSDSSLVSSTSFPENQPKALSHFYKAPSL